LDLWELERELAAQGYTAICGVDEAGRGPLAGPVFAAAVILPFGINIPEINDSKKLSVKKRERIYTEIKEKALAYAVAYSDVEEIYKRNIQGATYIAMNNAIELLCIKPDIALIDGNRVSGITHNNRCIIGGDGKSASIAAASILAKVSRDEYMINMAVKYPQYAFEKHKGYGTKLHYERLREHGPSEIHRVSFLNKVH